MNPQTISIATISILLDSLRFSVTPDARQVGLLVAERLMYTPSMGVCLGAGWVLSTLSLGTAWGVGGAGGAKQAATAAAAVPPRSSWRRYAVGCSLSLPVSTCLPSPSSFLPPVFPASNSAHVVPSFHSPLHPPSLRRPSPLDFLPALDDERPQSPIAQVGLLVFNICVLCVGRCE